MVNEVVFTGRAPAKRERRCLAQISLSTQAQFFRRLFFSKYPGPLVCRGSPGVGPRVSLSLGGQSQNDPPPEAKARHFRRLSLHASLVFGGGFSCFAASGALKISVQGGPCGAVNGDLARAPRRKRKMVRGRRCQAKQLRLEGCVSRASPFGPVKWRTALCASVGGQSIAQRMRPCTWAFALAASPAPARSVQPLSCSRCGNRREVLGFVLPAHSANVSRRTLRCARRSLAGPTPPWPIPTWSTS